jgi:hypothetical protein
LTISGLTFAYRSGPSRNWRKIKTAGWREANRERWSMSEAAVIRPNSEGRERRASPPIQYREYG